MVKSNITIYEYIYIYITYIMWLGNSKQSQLGMAQHFYTPSSRTSLPLDSGCNLRPFGDDSPKNIHHHSDIAVKSLQFKQKLPHVQIIFPLRLKSAIVIEDFPARPAMFDETRGRLAPFRRSCSAPVLGGAQCLSSLLGRKCQPFAWKLGGPENERKLRIFHSPKMIQRGFDMI